MRAKVYSESYGAICSMGAERARVHVSAAVESYDILEERWSVSAAPFGLQHVILKFADY